MPSTRGASTIARGRSIASSNGCAPTATRAARVAIVAIVAISRLDPAALRPLMSTLRERAADYVAARPGRGTSRVDRAIANVIDGRPIE